MKRYKKLKPIEQRESIWETEKRLKLEAKKLAELQREKEKND